MPATTKDRQEFAAVVAREFPHLTPDDVASTCRDLVRLATHHGRMAEDACNRELNPA